MTKYAFIKHEEGNFLQSEEWGEVANLVGHKAILKDFGQGDLALLIIKSARRGRYLEIPGGPLLDWDNKTRVEEIFSEIKKIAKLEKCSFIRFRPQLKNTPENLKKLPKGSRPAPFHLHAQNTVILDLEKSEDELLSNMRRQTRYEVRRSGKLELYVESGNSKELFEEFHRVQVETAKRQNFIPPSLDELEAYREIFKDNAKIYIVKTSKPISSDGKKLIEGEPSGDFIPENSTICYGLFIDYGSEVEYFEAASTEYGHLLPGAYAMLWAAMKDYKKKGLKRFNLWGIAPPNQPHHRYAGVTTFKTGFGGEQVEFIHAQDIVINPLKYQKTKIIENIRKKVRHLG
ncbi:MAG: peptidoglycan bridge formation glycyltransferase FemA/FemB family protein [Candidatus Saccharibacteria bacterium]|nr:peptidoglycan bridge formation glycyltransferase FemA/FemB family protein [Candidatus Saccharibacteria bacterium]